MKTTAFCTLFCLLSRFPPTTREKSGLSLGTHAGLAQVGRRSWLFLIASGLATGLSWVCYFRALSMGEASKVAPVDKLSVVFVVLLAWPLLGEMITWSKAAGALLIAAGAILLAWS